MGIANMAKISQEGILTIVEGVKCRDWNIEVDESILQAVRSKEAIIFKQVFPKELLKELKKLVTTHQFKANNYKDCGNGLPGNMYRLDSLQHREYAPRFIQLYCFTFWDKDTPEIVLKFMRTWGRFINKVRGFPPDSQFDTAEEFVFWLNAFHYPTTGFVGRHHKVGMQDYINEKVPFTESVLFLSKKGEDFQNGGLYLGERMHSDKVMHYIEPYLDWGDVLFFVNDLHHEIRPIDPDRPVDMDPLKNRFIFSLTSVSMESARKYFTGN